MTKKTCDILGQIVLKSREIGSGSQSPVVGCRPKGKEAPK